MRDLGTQAKNSLRQRNDASFDPCKLLFHSERRLRGYRSATNGARGSMENRLENKRVHTKHKFPLVPDFFFFCWSVPCTPVLYNSCIRLFVVPWSFNCDERCCLSQSQERQKQQRYDTTSVGLVVRGWNSRAVRVLLSWLVETWITRNETPKEHGTCVILSMSLDHHRHFLLPSNSCTVRQDLFGLLLPASSCGLRGTFVRTQNTLVLVLVNTRLHNP